MDDGLTPPSPESGACAGAPSRRRDREATTEALLDAAKCTFAARGFDAATTREIAAGAGVNEQLIQRYFGGKTGLLLAVVERFGKAEGQGCPLPPPGDCLATDIGTFLHQQVKLTWERRDLAKVVLDRALVDPAVAAEMSRTLSETRIPCLLARLETFRARGLIDPAADLPNIAAGIAALSFSLGFLEQVVFARNPEGVCAVMRTLAHTIARGLAPRPAPPRTGV
ncbi:MAG TPA: TetR/AcrR family transcriptional regulator [Azospirillum sp.]|nr:TetR/AcrR family transcriptional regulator [Azospirillum sp.]